MKKEITYQSLLEPIGKNRFNAVQRKYYPITWRWLYVAIVLIVAGVVSGGLAWPLVEAYLYEWLLIVVMSIASFAIVIKLSWSKEVRVRTESTIRKIRHEDFAKENDLEYIEKTVQPGYSGIVFASGINTPTAYDQFRLKEENGFEVGNYRFMADEVPGVEVVDGGYIRLKLERRVPHMLVKSFGWYGGALPDVVHYDGEQVLGLEGDFDQYFALLAPKEYERDALYVFTPDFMALLIDQVKYVNSIHGAGICVELVEDDLYIYCTKFDFTNVQEWKMIIGLISSIGTKTVSRTDLYSDEKVESRRANTIAKTGRRLKRESLWVLPLSAAMLGAYIAGFMYLIWFLNSRLG